MGDGEGWAELISRKRTMGSDETILPLREGIQPIIRIRYKHSALKQYLKDGRALRTALLHKC
jgi:hypothetical protein